MKCQLDSKTRSTLIGVFGIWMWFSMPIVSGTFMGIHIERTAADFNGVSYLLLASWGAYTYFSWKEQSVPKVIAAGLATLISGNYLIDLGFYLGLFFLFFNAASCAITALLENRTAALVAKAEAASASGVVQSNGQPE